MEELFTLRDHILNGRYGEALLAVEELEEMSRQDKENKIYSYAVILLLHLIKQEAEQRATRSWELSIFESARQIARTNKMRKAQGFYLLPDELARAVADAYPTALKRAAIEAFEGRYGAEELDEMVDREVIQIKALETIADFSSR